MPSSEILELYSLIGDQQYTTQYLPNLTSTRIVDLGTVMSATGTHKFVLAGFENFDSSVRVYIEDVLTGDFHNMSIDGAYTFTNDPSFTSTRFRLHFMAPIAVAATGTCLGENNGKMIINNPNDQIAISATLRNEQGVVVGASSSFVGEYVFNNLPTGSYGVDLALTATDVVTQYVNVDGGGILSPATFVASATEVSIADAIVEFSAEAQGASQFTWNFGDGVTQSGTATPVHAYTQPGIYTVALTASNGGCESTVSSMITVTNNATGIADVSDKNGFTIYPNPANENFNIFKSDKDKALFEMADVSGKVVLTVELNNKINNINTAQLAPGVYTGTMIQNDSRKSIRIVIAH
jgi:PKD repeat protein